jgi:Gnt-I system high-affinity gluconate transporter
MFVILITIFLLIILITWAKLHPFLAFLVVSLLAGWGLGIPLLSLTKSIKTGIGDMLGELIIIICLGAMLGKIVADSGAAKKISEGLLHTFGVKYIRWTMMLTGFVVGIPLFYNVGFVILVPLIFSIVYQVKLPPVYTGIPMLAALSVTHGFLPPHPSPTALVAQFNAHLGYTLLYGLLVSIPAIVLAGPIFAQTLRNLHSSPLPTFQANKLANDKMPSTFNAFFSALLPVILLSITTALPFCWEFAANTLIWINFLGDAVIVMLICLTFTTYTLGIAQGMKIKSLMDSYSEAVKDVAVILLIVAGAGALKQILKDSGVSQEIGTMLQGLSLNPLILGWLIAAIIRVCIGSATVAGLTAAGIIAPTLPQMNTDPNLMVLAVGAGSIMFSHVNDSGFWLFKEYFNISIKQTFRSWTLMETIVSVLGLLGVLVLDFIIKL